MKEECNEAYSQALKVLKRCVHPLGMKASAHIDGYPQIWARDSMIAVLGASLTGDRKLLRALKSSFEILKKKQTPLGSIPNNVYVKNLKPNYQAYADTGMWFVAGNEFLFRQTKDKTFLRKNYAAIKKTLSWYEYQNTDQTGLITIEESSDWQDLFAVRGKGLYVNVLNYLALRKAGLIARALGDVKYEKECLKKARNLRSRINHYFWWKGNDNAFTHIKFSFGTQSSAENSKRLMAKISLPFEHNLNDVSYYLPYLTFRSYGYWIDSFGNLLAILSGVADAGRASAVMESIRKYKLAEPYPIKAIHPPIYPEDKDWRYYYQFEGLSMPHQYHNGGIWPFLGGFYVAALVKMKKHRQAEKALEKLAELNMLGASREWEFNEWFHGETAKAMGNPHQAWSASMYIYAYEAVRRKKAIFF